MPLLAALKGEKSCSRELGVCKTPIEQALTPSVGSSPFLSSKLFERTGSTSLEFVLTSLVPIRRFARWADSRLSLSALTRHPFVGAPVAFIPFLLERNQCHDANILHDGNILSRYILCLTDVYLISNIFLR